MSYYFPFSFKKTNEKLAIVKQEFDLINDYYLQLSKKVQPNKELIEYAQSKMQVKKEQLLALQQQ